MPELTDRYAEVPNPNYPADRFADTYRTTTLSAAKGLKARWSPLKSTGNWKVRTLLFDRQLWPDMEACQAWARAHREELKSMATENVKVKAVALADRVTFGPRPSEDDLAIINEMALEPQTAEGVYVRRMALANDKVDRDLERFSRGVLEQFAATLPGKSVLVGHDKQSAPVGRFYRAEVKRDNGQSNLLGYWYAPVTADNEHDRKSIDAGVWRDVSIGFRWDEVTCDLCGNDYQSKECAHVHGQPYPLAGLPAETDTARLELTDDKESAICTITYRGKAEALEGSIVYLGAQYGAEMVKAKQAGDFGAMKRLLMGPTTDDEPPGDPDLASDGGAVAEGGEKGATHGPPAEAGQEGGITAAESEGVNMTDEEIGTLKAELETAKAAMDAAVAEKAAHEAKVADLTGQVAALRQPHIDDLERLGLVLHREPELDALKGAFGETYGDMPTDRLLALKGAWQKSVDAENPGGRQSTPTATQEPGAGDAPTATTVKTLTP